MPKIWMKKRSRKSSLYKLKGNNIYIYIVEALVVVIKNYVTSVTNVSHTHTHTHINENYCKQPTEPRYKGADQWFK